MADPIKLPPGATLVSGGDMKLPPGATLVTDSGGSGGGGQPQQGFFGSALDSSGLTSLGHAIAHPVDTVMGIPSAVSGIVHNTTDNIKQGVADYKKSGLSETTRRDFGRAVPILGPTLATAQAQHDAGNDAGMAGTLTGTVASMAAPFALKGAGDALPGVLAKVGDASQESGVGLMNKTIGTLKPDFRRGANPGRGYFEAGGKPALSMQGLADQGTNLKTTVGQAIPTVLGKSGAVIPGGDIAPIINKPIAKAMALELGPGGTGNVAPIENYAAGFTPAMKAAQQGGGMTPLQLWEMKKSIAANTSWSDPAQFNLKSVRQQQAGGLGGLISDNVPEVAPLNQQYGDLTKFVTRAQSRADTHSMPLTSLMFKTGAATLGGAAGLMDGHPLLGAAIGAAADSVPVKSALAAGLYHGGRGIVSLGDGVAAIPGLSPAAIAIPAQYLAAKKKDKGQ